MHLAYAAQLPTEDPGTPRPPVFSFLRLCTRAFPIERISIMIRCFSLPHILHLLLSLTLTRRAAACRLDDEGDDDEGDEDARDRRRLELMGESAIPQAHLLGFEQHGGVERGGGEKESADARRRDEDSEDFDFDCAGGGAAVQMTVRY